MARLGRLLRLVLEHDDRPVLVEQGVADPPAGRAAADRPELGTGQLPAVPSSSTVSVQSSLRVTTSSTEPSTGCQSSRSVAASERCRRVGRRHRPVSWSGRDVCRGAARLSLGVGRGLGRPARRCRRRRPASAAGSPRRRTAGVPDPPRIRRRRCGGSGPGWRGSSGRRRATGRGRCRARTGRSAAGSTARSSRGARASCRSCRSRGRPGSGRSRCRRGTGSSACCRIGCRTTGAL